MSVSICPICKQKLGTFRNRRLIVLLTSVNGAIGNEVAVITKQAELTGNVSDGGATALSVGVVDQCHCDCEVLIYVHVLYVNELVADVQSMSHMRDTVLNNLVTAPIFRLG